MKKIVLMLSAFLVAGFTIVYAMTDDDGPSGIPTREDIDRVMVREIKPAQSGVDITSQWTNLLTPIQGQRANWLNIPTEKIVPQAKRIINHQKDIIVEALAKQNNLEAIRGQRTYSFIRTMLNEHIDKAKQWFFQIVEGKIKEEMRAQAKQKIENELRLFREKIDELIPASAEEPVPVLKEDSEPIDFDLSDWDEESE